MSSTNRIAWANCTAITSAGSIVQVACYRSGAVNEERLGPPQEFAGRLAGHLARLADPALPLPGKADLLALVDVIFFASLHEEEARRAQFYVAWQTAAGHCSGVAGMGWPVPA